MYIYQVAETCISAESTNPFEFFILLSLYITVSAHFHFNIFLKSIYFFSWQFPLYRLKLSPLSNIFQTGFSTYTPVKRKLIFNTTATCIFWKWKCNCAKILLRSFLVDFHCLQVAFRLWDRIIRLCIIALLPANL